MLRRITKHGELILLLSLIAVTLYLITVGLKIPVGRSRAVITPSFWPVASLGIVVFCSAILLAIRFVRRNKNAQSDSAAAADADADGMPNEEAKHPQRAVYTLLFMVVYLAVLPLTGFILTTLIVTAVYMLAIGASRRYAFIIPFGMTVLITAIFALALKVPLPRGVSLFREVSLLFY